MPISKCLICISEPCECSPGFLQLKEGLGKIFDKPVKDSGKRDEFKTGAVRDLGENKGAYELISPIFLKRLAILLEKGAAKYDARNWEKGMPMGRTFQSLIRHAYQYLEGCRDEDHLAAVAFNSMLLIHYEEMIVRGKLPKELNDLPDFT